MRYRWARKNIVLADVFLVLKDFFDQCTSCSVIESDRLKMRILARVLVQKNRKPREVETIVRATRNGFEIDFAYDRSSGVLARSGFFSTMLGTGFLFKEKVDDVAFLERFEKEFWLFVEEKIDALK